MKHFLYFVLLAFSLLSSIAQAQIKPIKFDISLSEFLLKHYSTLVHQLLLESGLGYQSLEKQLNLWGCSDDILKSKKLLSTTEAVEFNQAFKGLTSSCRPDSNQSDISNILNGKEPYLIISGESLKSPMSYFGHASLLFLDRENFYFSPVVSFTAVTQNMSTAEQIIKGGFSLIQGQVSILPLHQIIDAYNNRESRELTFIKIDQKKYNKGLLVNSIKRYHRNELDYNFFTKNCSTYIYQALNDSCSCLPDKKIISPLNLEYAISEGAETEEFTLQSLYNKFNSAFDSLKQKEKSQLKSILLGKDTNYREDNDLLKQATILASRLRFESYASPYPSYGKIFETYGSKNSLLESIPQHTPSDTSLKDSLRTSSIKVRTSGQDFSLGISAVDYDHLEQRSKNYTLYQLKAGAIEMSERDGNSKIETIELLSVQSLSPIDFVTHLPSWKLRLGASNSDNDRLKPLLELGVGAAVRIGSLTLYTMPTFGLQESSYTDIYYGAKFHSSSFMAQYELKNSSKSALSLYRRESPALGYGYKLTSDSSSEVKHEAVISFYF